MSPEVVVSDADEERAPESVRVGDAVDLSGATLVEVSIPPSGRVHFVVQAEQLGRMTKRVARQGDRDTKLMVFDVEGVGKVGVGICV